MSALRHGRVCCFLQLFAFIDSPLEPPPLLSSISPIPRLDFCLFPHSFLIRSAPRYLATRGWDWDLLVGCFTGAFQYLSALAVFFHTSLFPLCAVPLVLVWSFSFVPVCLSAPPVRKHEAVLAGNSRDERFLFLGRNPPLSYSFFPLFCVCLSLVSLFLYQFCFRDIRLG